MFFLTMWRGGEHNKEIKEFHSNGMKIKDWTKKIVDCDEATKKIKSLRKFWNFSLLRIFEGIMVWEMFLENTIRKPSYMEAIWNEISIVLLIVMELVNPAFLFHIVLAFFRKCLKFMVSIDFILFQFNLVEFMVEYLMNVKHLKLQ